MPDRIPVDEIGAALDAHLSTEALAAEARFFADPDQRGSERPYGWGWALRLQAELLALDDADAAHWAKNMEPLVGLFVKGLVEWLPKLDYPVRSGLQANPAFAFSLALPFAHSHLSFLAAVREAALRWYGADAAYAAQWEPSAFDFILPALTEAELLSSLLQQPEFSAWLARFLPGIVDAEPAALFTPAEVSDPTDGHIAHLHGLNLSRAWCWLRVARALPGGDPRSPVMLEAAERHAEASLDEAVGSNYAVEHWLPAYAVLYLGELAD